MRAFLVNGNVFFGIFTICIGVAALSITKGAWIPDVISTGIWGGVYLLTFSVLLKRKRALDTTSVAILANYAILVGITLIAIHSWSIYMNPQIFGMRDLIIHYKTFTITQYKRFTIDSMMIVSGILTVIINTLIVIIAFKGEKSDYFSFVPIPNQNC